MMQIPDPLNAGAEAAAGYIGQSKQNKLTADEQKRLQAELALRTRAQQFSEQQATQAGQREQAQFDREGQWHQDDVTFRTQQAKHDEFYRHAQNLRDEHADMRAQKQAELERKLAAGQISQQQLNNELTKIDLHYATALKALELQGKQMGLQLDQAQLGLIGAETAHANAETANVGHTRGGKPSYGDAVMDLSAAGQKFLSQAHSKRLTPTSALLALTLDKSLSPQDRQLLPQILSAADYSKFGPKPADTRAPALQDLHRNMQWKFLQPTEAEFIEDGVRSAGSVDAFTQYLRAHPQLANKYLSEQGKAVLFGVPQ